MLAKEQAQTIENSLHKAELRITDTCIANSSKQQPDQAWVTIDSHLPVADLLEFCQDIERLLRINPYLEFSHLQQTGEGKLTMQGKNLSNQQSFDYRVNSQHYVNNDEEGYLLTYSSGLKCSTTISIKKQEHGTQIKILDDYSGISEEERNQRLEEVDKSLPAWGNAIQQYLTAWQKWSRFSLWRWYKQRVWLPMKPSARRISWMLINITALEFVAFLMVFVIFWLELDQYFRL